MAELHDIEIGLTEHLEGPASAPSKAIFDQASQLVRAADALGVRYAWFAEHHIHVHRGHLPTPLLLALHLASQTSNIHLGTAVICLNHHNPIDIAEQVAVADTLIGGRMAVGFGSGSTPREAALFAVPDSTEDERHARYAEALDAIERWWSTRADHEVAPHERLPRASGDLMRRCWSAVNSVGAARIAGERNLNVLFSHLRTPEQYRTYADAYRAAGGTNRIAANRPLIIGSDDADAWRLAEPAVRTLWRTFRAEGKIAAEFAEPDSIEALCAHPLNFIVGGPASVARQIAALHHEVPFDVLNVEVTWSGLDPEASIATLERLMRDVLPLFRGSEAADPSHLQETHRPRAATIHTERSHR